MTRRTLFPALLLTLGACASGATNGATNGATRRVAAAPAFSAGNDAAMIARDIGYLADPRLEGRGTGTAGNDSAAAYLVRRYAELGLTGTLQKFVAKEPVRGGEPRALPTQNVYSVVPGRDASLRAEYVIIGAHFDHLGRSSTGALDPEAGNIIHPGADDNASGTAAVLALAARFKRSPAKRTVLFVNFTGEELGLLGSAYFADHAPVPISSVQAMVNFDMIGRLRNDKLIVYGVATATEMPDILAKANTGGLKLNAVGDGFGPSDHASFYAKDMPVLHMFTDLHDQYHRASDVASTIDAAGEVRVVEFAERVVRDLADRPARLTFTKAPTTSTPRAAERTGSGVYLGSIPDMGSADVVGMKITGVRAGSPADLGGLKTNDVIVEFDGTVVKDIYSYTDALNAHKPGDLVKIVVLRGTERTTLTVTLGKRGG
ncbi:MAG: M20/M25/M40 family metallo-hydrolase [bacterium]